ncbi:MAG: hypothetical protein PHC43_00025 [Candidatus Marinimicrobia bacterium]|jgi:hypothetical protein|nr:hypothetical protein [Candidatus Neomarinimicrobiota bacterium]
MRLSDTTLVVSAIFKLANQTGTDKITPSAVTEILTKEFRLNLPLHQVSEIMSSIGIVTRTVQNNRFLIWNPQKMEKLKETYLIKISACYQ